MKVYWLDPLYEAALPTMPDVTEAELLALLFPLAVESVAVRFQALGKW